MYLRDTARSHLSEKYSRLTVCLKKKKPYSNVLAMVLIYLLLCIALNCTCQYISSYPCRRYKN